MHELFPASYYIEGQTDFFVCPVCYQQSEIKYSFSIDVPDTTNGAYVGFSNVTCAHCGEEMVRIDRVLINSIIVMNKAGISTTGCCEGHCNRLYGSFTNKNLESYIGPWIDINADNKIAIVALANAINNRKDLHIELDVTGAGIRFSCPVCVDEEDHEKFSVFNGIDYLQNKYEKDLKNAQLEFLDFVDSFVEEYRKLTKYYSQNFPINSK